MSIGPNRFGEQPSRRIARRWSWTCWRRMTGPSTYRFRLLN